MSNSLLIVDDNMSLLLSLKQALAGLYAVEVCQSGAEALRKISDDGYDCVILDANLLDTTGLAVCRQLRQAGNGVPVIILSGDDAPAHIAELLDAGADDYIVKPAKTVELQARIRTVIRRTRLPQSLGTCLNIHGVTLDSPHHRVCRDGMLLDLRPKEFALLECLMNSAGRVVSRPILLRYAWEEASDVWTNVVDVHIKYLRDKLDQPFDVALIHTVRGIGYKFDASKVAYKIKGGNIYERTIASRAY